MTYIFTFTFPCSKSNYFIPDCIYLLLHKALKIQPASENLYQRRKKVLSVYYSFNSDFQEEFQCTSLSTIGQFLPCSLFYVSQNRLTLYSLSVCSFQKIKHSVFAAMKLIQIFCKYSLQCLTTLSQVNINILRDVISLKN